MLVMEELASWLTVRSVKGLGERSIKKLWNRYRSARAILEAPVDELVEVVGRKKAQAIRDREGVSDRKVERTLYLVKREGVGWLTLESELYPPPLRDIPDPPPVLFYMGVWEERSLAGVVGARKATAYTLGWTKEVVKELVGTGIGIVSGGAPGVDRQAHLSALESSGYTVCVLGTGILRAKGDLFGRIKEGKGLLVSELDLLERGSSFTFPRRNRLIAALSDFLLVPQAGKRSGALITAGFAREYGKKVYVHIGLGSSSLWDGCYELVKKYGAELVKGAGDFLPKSSRDALAEFLCVPRTVDELADFWGVSTGEALSRLSRLELEGKVEKVGPYYRSA